MQLLLEALGNDYLANSLYESGIYHTKSRNFPRK